MLLCDINCDMGEGIGNDAAIMPYVSSANIACGYHAGTEHTMSNTILLAKKHRVNVGAHPSFFDPENFGRKEIRLTANELYELVQKQLTMLQSIAATHGIPLQHVKPHGALYNLSAKDIGVANAIAQAIKEFDSKLVLFGLSGSVSITAAQKLGLATKSEVFADRTYRDDGSLTPRAEPNALIENTSEAVDQVLQMVHKKNVKAITGKIIPVVAETICVHGDGKHAVEFAKAIHQALTRG